MLKGEVLGSDPGQMVRIDLSGTPSLPQSQVGELRDTANA